MRNAEENRLLVKPKPSFIVDSMLGSVAKKLRFFGFDTCYAGSQPDFEIIQLGIEQERVILTSDKEMYKRVIRLRAKGTLLNGLGDFENIAQAFFSYGSLLSSFLLLRPRCPICNGRTIKVPRSRLKRDVRCFEGYTLFFQCSGCGKIYWEGSHYKSLKALSKRIDGFIVERLKESRCYTVDRTSIPILEFCSWSVHLA